MGATRPLSGGADTRRKPPERDLVLGRGTERLCHRCSRESSRSAARASYGGADAAVGHNPVLQGGGETPAPRTSGDALATQLVHATFLRARAAARDRAKMRFSPSAEWCPIRSMICIIHFGA